MATPLETIRVLVKDTASPPLVDDTEVQCILDLEGNIYRAAAAIARSYSAIYARRTSLTAGPVRLENTQRFEHYDALADAYDQRAREGGGSGAGAVGASIELTGISISEIEANRDDQDRYGSVFYRGMDDNPSETENFNDEDC